MRGEHGTTAFVGGWLPFTSRRFYIPPRHRGEYSERIDQLSADLDARGITTSPPTHRADLAA